ncbi:hypothetical protein GCM10017710_21430 [Arthrobacter ramosus]
MLHANPQRIDPNRKESNASENDRLPTRHVGELRVDRNRDGLREQVGGEEPRERGEPADFMDDRRHRGGHDGGIDRDEAAREHQGYEYRAPFGTEAYAVTLSCHVWPVFPLDPGVS